MYGSVMNGKAWLILYLNREFSRYSQHAAADMFAVLPPRPQSAPET